MSHPRRTERRGRDDRIARNPRAVSLMAEPITMVALDIAGTSIDEGGAVYVALRNAVESHTGRPVPDEVFDRWKGTGKREAIIGLIGTASVGEIDAVESD